MGLELIRDRLGRLQLRKGLAAQATRITRPAGRAARNVWQPRNDHQRCGAEFARTGSVCPTTPRYPVWHPRWTCISFNGDGRRVSLPNLLQSIDGGTHYRDQLFSIEWLLQKRCGFAEGNRRLSVSRDDDHLDTLLEQVFDEVRCSLVF